MTRFSLRETPAEAERREAREALVIAEACLEGQIETIGKSMMKASLAALIDALDNQGQRSYDLAIRALKTALSKK